MIEIFVIVASGLVVEALMEVFKSIFEPKELPSCVIRLITLVVGVGFAVNFNLQLLSAFGFVGISDLVDIVSTGMLIGGGSNLAYDIIKQLQTRQDELHEENLNK